jgi:hypothetical protein
MALHGIRPWTREIPVDAQSTSLTTNPVAAAAIAPVSGYIVRCGAGITGANASIVTVAVAINGGTDICGGNLTIASSTSTAARNNPLFEIPEIGAGTTSGVKIEEGDVITFTPSGSTSAAAAGAFVAVIHEGN